VTRAACLAAALAMCAAPSAAQPRGIASPLQARIDAAPAGATIDVAAGTYDGDLVVDRPLQIVGHGRVVVRGSGAGTVIAVTAPDVTVEGIEVDGRGGGDLGRDPSGIHVAGTRARIVRCVIRNALFGVYLRAADGAVVQQTRVYGIKGKAAGEKGSGIHVWNTTGFTLLDNEIADVRDGIYIQSSPHGTTRGNRATDVRYGLHYMNSDDNTFEDNLFERGDAGTAIMYSRRLTFRRNRFLRNRGFASAGLLLKSCEDVLAEHNLIADNARGVFIEGSDRITIRGNVVAQSDIALIIFASTARTAIEGNTFVGNMAPLSLVGRRTDTRVSGNYWSDNAALDLDGDGITDRPYRLTSLFDHFRGNLTAADLFSRGPSAAALAAAERAFPVLDASPLADPAPLARPAALPVPAADSSRTSERAGIGLLAAALATAGGVLLLMPRYPGGARRRQAAAA
jgi:nitrous oxidase accessory protein